MRLTPTLRSVSIPPVPGTDNFMTIEEKQPLERNSSNLSSDLFPFEVAIDRMMILFSIVSLGYRFTYFYLY